MNRTVAGLVSDGAAPSRFDSIGAISQAREQHLKEIGVKLGHAIVIVNAAAKLVAASSERAAELSKLADKPAAAAGASSAPSAPAAAAPASSSSSSSSAAASSSSSAGDRKAGEHQLSAEQEFTLGVQFERGDAGANRDMKQAFKHFERAMRLGSADAMVKVGRYYLEGFNSVRIDWPRAFQLLSEAYARKGARAAYELGHLYLNGDLCKKNLAQAKRIWATDPDCPLCQVSLLQTKRTNLSKADKAKLPSLLRTLEQLANGGDLQGIVELSQCYHQGLGVQQSDEKRLALLRKLANEAGFAWAQQTLAAVLWGGEEDADDDADFKAAFELCQQAANQGDPVGMASLASCFELGTGVPKDSALALHWLQQAASGGQGSAQGALGQHYLHGTLGLPQDEAQAQQWLQKAAANGDDDAKEALKEMKDAKASASSSSKRKRKEKKS